MSELSSRRKSYLKTTRLSKADSKKCKEDVKGSLMKFLSDCDTEDLLMNAVASPRKRISPLSMSEHTSSTANKMMQNHHDFNSTKIKSKAHDDHRVGQRLSPSQSIGGGREGRGGIGASEHGTSTCSPGSLRKAQSARLMLESSGSSNNIKKKKKKKKSKSTRMRNGNNSDGNDSDGDSSVSISPPSSPISSSSSSRRSIRSRKESAATPFSERSSRNSPGRFNSNKKSISKRPAPPRRHNSEQGTAAASTMRSPAAKSRTRSREHPRRSRSEGRMAGALDRKLSKDTSTSSRSNSSRRRFSSSDDNDNVSVGSTRSSMSAMSRRSAASAPGLDAGPLNAFLNHADHMSSSTRSNNRGGSVSVSGGGGEESEKQHEEFLKRRKSRQDEILGEAMQGRWNQSQKKDKAHRRNSTSSYGDSGNETDTNNNHDDMDDMDDDDQPMMVVKGRKNPLRQLRRGLNKTAKTTRSAAKGSVNVVKNPKRAAKNIGGFAKDVGKETMKLALDPTLAAQTVGKVGAKGIGKTINITAGVAEVSVGLTKSVAKTGLKTTTKMAGTVVDGAGKLLGLADKEDEDGDNYDDYHAKDLNSRRRTNLTLLDRVGGRDEEDDNPENDLESKGDQNARVAKATSSLLIPMASTGKGSSWDF